MLLRRTINEIMPNQPMLQVRCALKIGARHDNYICPAQGSVDVPH